MVSNRNDTGPVVSSVALIVSVSGRVSIVLDVPGIVLGGEVTG